MKSDINIPEVENVFFTAVPEWSDDFMENIWNVYLVNDSDFDLDSIMVVSKAFGTIDGEMKKTSLLRHAFVKVPSVSVVKVELLDDSVLRLNNEFMVTYFVLIDFSETNFDIGRLNNRYLSTRLTVFQQL